MRLEDVKIGMRVRAKEDVGILARGYVTPLDLGTVLQVDDKNNKNTDIQIKWDSPQERIYDVWWINIENIEPIAEINPNQSVSYEIRYTRGGSMSTRLDSYDELVDYLQKYSTNNKPHGDTIITRIVREIVEINF